MQCTTVHAQQKRQKFTQNQNPIKFSILCHTKSSKKVEKSAGLFAKIRDNLARGKSAKLFLVSLSQQFTAGGPEALLRSIYEKC